MKILVVSSLFPPWHLGGAEVVAESSARALAELGHAVHVLTLSPDRRNWSAAKDGYQVRSIPLSNIYSIQAMSKASTAQKVLWHIKDRWNFPMQTYFANELESIQPDIVLLHNIAGFSISVYESLIAASIPFVQVLHDHYFGCIYSNRYRKGRICENQCLRCSILRKNHPRYSQRANGVIAVSKSILDYTQSFGCFTEVPSRVINNLSPNSVNSKLLDRTSSLNQRAGCTVGYLGVLSESKGIFDLIESFRTAAGPSDFLKIAGHINVNQIRLLREIGSDSRIEYLGIAERESFFSTIDCLIVPSKWAEPFGLVAQEACFRGVPVLVSNRGGLPEAIEGAEAAYVFDASEPEGLTAALKTLLSDRHRWRRNKAISEFEYETRRRNWGKSYEYFLYSCASGVDKK